MMAGSESVKTGTHHVSGVKHRCLADLLAAVPKLSDSKGQHREPLNVCEANIVMHKPILTDYFLIFFFL